MPDMRDNRFGGMGDDLPADEGLADGPIDFSAIQADDALLDMLRSGDTGTEGTLTDAQVTDLLVAWRRDIDAEPIPELIDLDTALQALTSAGRRTRTGPHRFGVPLASAASVLLVAFGGLGVAAHSAQPGEPLWGLTRVLYADHARSVEAAAAVRTELAKADAALREGRWEEAEASLRRARAQLAVIEPDQGREDLIAQHAELMDQLRSAPLPPPTPAAPPPAAASTTEMETPPEAPADSSAARSAPKTTTEKPTPTSTEPPPTTTTPAPASGDGISGDTNSAPGALPNDGLPAQPMSQPSDGLSSDGSLSAAPPVVYIVETELA